MSKFIDSMYGAWLNKRRDASWPEPIKHITTAAEMVSPAEVQTFTELREYKISAEYKRHVTCKPKDLNHMIEACKKDLRVHVFGDLLDTMIELDQALYAYDHRESREKLKALWRILEG